MKFKTPVTVKIITGAQVREDFKSKLDPKDEEELRHTQEAYIQLGLVPPGTDLVKGYLELGESGLAGFYEHGSGEPAIVFINPIAYGLATFEPILEQLCQEFRVITVDCRGAGRSDPLVRPYSTLQHMEDLRAIIEAAVAAPIVGVGISRGSNLLIQLAHAHR